MVEKPNAPESAIATACRNAVNQINVSLTKCQWAQQGPATTQLKQQLDFATTQLNAKTKIEEELRNKNASLELKAMKLGQETEAVKAKLGQETEAAKVNMESWKKAQEQLVQMTLAKERSDKELGEWSKQVAALETQLTVSRVESDKHVKNLKGIIATQGEAEKKLVQEKERLVKQVRDLQESCSKRRAGQEDHHSEPDGPSPPKKRRPGPASRTGRRGETVTPPAAAIPSAVTPPAAIPPTVTPPADPMLAVSPAAARTSASPAAGTSAAPLPAVAATAPTAAILTGTSVSQQPEPVEQSEPTDEQPVAEHPSAEQQPPAEPSPVEQPITLERLTSLADTWQLNEQQRKGCEEVSSCVDEYVEQLLQLEQPLVDQAFETVHENTVSQQSLPEAATALQFARGFLQRAGNLDKLPPKAREILLRALADIPVQPQPAAPRLRTRLVPAPRPNHQPPTPYPNNVPSEQQVRCRLSEPVHLSSLYTYENQKAYFQTESTGLVPEMEPLIDPI